MPGTARRFGVSRPFDPTENVRGGTQYLRELLKMFNGQVDLALASYNAGEGRVISYGNKVPPFQETPKLRQTHQATIWKRNESSSTAELRAHRDERSLGVREIWIRVSLL